MRAMRARERNEYCGAHCKSRKRALDLSYSRTRSEFDPKLENPQE